MSLRGSIAIIAGGLVAAGCAPTYPTHPIAEFPPGAMRRLGCLEIGFEAERDAALPAASLLVQVRVENLCHDPTLVDLNALKMWADRKNGDRFELAFYDPRNEIVPLHVDINADGLERLQVDGAGEPGSLKQICFDPSRVGGKYVNAGAVCYRFDHEPSPADPEPAAASSTDTPEEP